MSHELDLEDEEEDDALPVLNAVVESGNESIIQSSRLGREVLRELEMLQQSSPVKFVLQDHILDHEYDASVLHQESPAASSARLEDSSLDYLSQNALTQDEFPQGHLSQDSEIDLMIDDSDAISAGTSNSEDEIELMIDIVVDRHIVELRKDIRRLIMRLKTNT